MEIMLNQVQIQNLRSIKNSNILLNSFSVLFGMNDSGKSNLILALRLAFGNASIDAKDVFSSPESPYSTAHKVSIDLKFVPVDSSGQQVAIFNDLWGLHLGSNVMTDADDNEFFAFRTEFVYDDEKEEYIRDRKIISEWNNTTIRVGESLRYKTLSAFEFIFLDAQRDIALDLRDKASLWSKQISKLKLSPTAKTEVEMSLSILSEKIMSESPFLQQVSLDLTSATNTRNSTVEISPVTRSVDELYKGLDIYIAQKSAATFPISNLGLGTRSRAVFSALKTIINKKLNDARDTPYFCMIAFEEPESHIHPHSQCQLVKDFASIEGQRIITTHSPYILSTTNISDLIYVALRDAETVVAPLSTLNLGAEALRHINRFVMNTRGELLFSNIAVLAEGETEEQALQVFFREYFGAEPYELGVSIVGVGGKNYLPFLRMLEIIGTKWYIFSDGEPAAINDLQSTLKQLRELPTKPDLSQFSNIIVLENSNDYEKYLLDAGYADEIVAAINNYEDTELEDYQISYFDHYLQEHNGESMSPRSTGVKCVTCGEVIKTKPLRDYLTAGGKERAICDCMKSGKTKYAVPISRAICTGCIGERKFPPKIKLLLENIKLSLEG